MLRAAWYLRLGAAASSRATSSGLNTTGSRRGSRANTISSVTSPLRRVTLKKKRSAVMAAFTPRLSGSCRAPLDLCLPRVSNGWDRDLKQSVDGAPVHQIGADEAGEGGRSGDGTLPGMSEPQQQERDERNRDLDADGVLGGAEEAGDLQGLLDPAEEQLDLPALLVKIGNLLGRRVKVVGEDAQFLAGLGQYPDLAHGILHRVLSAASLARWQEPDAVGQDGAAGRQRQLLDHLERRVALDPGDDAALRLIQFGPPRVVIVAEIKDVGGTSQDRHGVGGGDVVDVGRADCGIDRPLGIGIVDDVQLGAAGVGGKARPVSA